MNLQPLRNKVAVKEVSKESKSDSGIVLMGSTGNTAEFGVVAIGPDVDCVKVGDRVFIEVGKATLVDMGTLVIEDKYIAVVLEND
jgi:co-chaperonin GroES (HSP10)